jgi:hypothetical protein
MFHRVVILGLLAGISLVGSGCKPCCSAEAAGEAKDSLPGDGSQVQTYTCPLTGEQLPCPKCCPLNGAKADSPKSDCCDKPDPKADSVKADCCEKPKAATQQGDPTRQVIFKVEGLTCPAVKGLGCGHRLAPVLARLNKIGGVEKSFSNRTGTMVRISVGPSADRDKVAAAVSEDLTKDSRKPVLLAGDDLKQALVKEEWSSPGDLSAIEFRTFALHRVKTFADAEKLDKEASSKLVKIAEQQWERMAKGGDCCGKLKQPGDWLAQFKQFATSVPDQAKELLTAEQVERLRQVLTKRLEEKDMPIAADAKQK